MMRVWSDNERAGVLDRLALRGSTFVYEPGVGHAREVSLICDATPTVLLIPRT